MTNPLVEQIRQLAEPPLVAAGYECVEIEYKREQTGWVCRIYIDKPGGITHRDCVTASRDLSPLLDVHDVIPHAYQLEVTSPGVNRPLRTAAHFRAQLGQEARARLHTGVGGRKKFRGTIVAVSDADETVTLRVDGVDYALPLADLERANLEYSFE